MILSLNLLAAASHRMKRNQTKRSESRNDAPGPSPWPLLSANSLLWKCYTIRRAQGPFLFLLGNMDLAYVV